MPALHPVLVEDFVVLGHVLAAGCFVKKVELRGREASVERSVSGAEPLFGGLDRK